MKDPPYNIQHDTIQTIRRNPSTTSLKINRIELPLAEQEAFKFSFTILLIDEMIWLSAWTL